MERAAAWAAGSGAGTGGCGVEGRPRVLVRPPHFHPFPPGRHVHDAGAVRALDEAKARFAAAEGDAVTYLNVYRAWGLEGGRASKW